jgi:fatty-acyl-CoA synthase
MRDHDTEPHRPAAAITFCPNSSDPYPTDEPYHSRRQNWNTQLARHALMQPNATALRFQDSTVTWAELDRRVSNLADALDRCGVDPGDRVLILMFNRVEYIESLLAITKLGAIAVPVNFRLTPPEIAHLVADCAPRVMITESALAPVAHAVRGLDRTVATVIIADVDTNTDDGILGYEDLLAEKGPAHEPVDVPDGNPALLMYTSGTTGRPKGAVLTHTNLSAQTLSGLATGGADLQNDVEFIGVPLFHIAGLRGALVGLWLGLPTVVYPAGSFDAGRLLDVISAEKVTSLFLVPPQWQSLCRAQQAQPRHTRLRLMRWGAAPASDSLLREMAETFPGAPILGAFGQTEMSPMTCVLLGDEAVRKFGSVGKVIPTVAARIVDPEMNDVPIGGVGEIIYRAPTLMAGYWNNPTATAEAFTGGWFHSGDLVRQDDEGYIWVVDRKKDMIISGGENIYCSELENVLAGHPAIIEVTVIGRAHRKWGEVPVAVAAVTDSRLTIADLEGFLNERLARYKHPKALEIVDALPRNAAGKVLKTELRLQFGAASESPASSEGVTA